MNEWQRIKKLGGEGILTREDIRDLDTQRIKVLWLMLDYKWHPGPEIVRVAGGSEGLRRLRELREIPDILIERKRDEKNRVFLYRLIHGTDTGLGDSPQQALLL